jgi:rod shape-determining protein MreD
MIKSIIFSTLAVCVFSILQSTVIQHVAIMNVAPDLALTVFLLISLRNGSMAGQFTGFAVGFLQDFISSAPMGFHSLINVVIGFLYGLFKGTLFVDKLLVPIVAAVIGTILKGILTDFLGLLFPRSIPSYDLFSYEFWIEVGYNAILAPLVFFAVGLIRPLFIRDRKL